MSRKRLISPAFFRHWALFAAERDSELPLRVAYAGLWCVADRRGVFRWSEDLKPEVLPYDSVDILKVLGALKHYGFIGSYVVDGREYGHIPTLPRHQHFHRAERPDSTMPAPGEHGASTVLAPVQPPASTSVARRISDIGISSQASTPRVRESDSLVSNADAWLGLPELPQVEQSPTGSAPSTAVVLASVASTTIAVGEGHASGVAAATVALASVAKRSRKRIAADGWRLGAAAFVFAYWASKLGKPRALWDATDRRARKLVDALAANRDDVSELLYVVDGARRDPHLMGEKGGPRFDGVETLFRDRAQVERLAALCPAYVRGEAHPVAAEIALSDA